MSYTQVIELCRQNLTDKLRKLEHAYGEWEKTGFSRETSRGFDSEAFQDFRSVVEDVLDWECKKAT